MALDIVRLLELASWRAFDADGAGRVLAGSDESGSVQLVELADGTTAVTRAAEVRLPADTALVVVADHGMVAVDPESVLDFDTTPALAEGVRLLGGDPRARHVYAEPGARDDVLATWRELLG